MTNVLTLKDYGQLKNTRYIVYAYNPDTKLYAGNSGIVNALGAMTYITKFLQRGWLVLMAESEVWAKRPIVSDDIIKDFDYQRILIPLLYYAYENKIEITEEILLEYFKRQNYIPKIQVSSLNFESELKEN